MERERKGSGAGEKGHGMVSPTFHFGSAFNCSRHYIQYFLFSILKVFILEFIELIASLKLVDV
jgi:hypothetical protein